MQFSKYHTKYQMQSNAMITLNRQIQNLTPLKISFQNLSKYHQKISYDLQSLISEHNYSINALKSTIQNFSLILDRTEQQKSINYQKLNQIGNQNNKLIFENKNLALKFESLNQKLKLQFSQSQSNQSFQGQLENIRNSLKYHIQSLQKLNLQLLNQQDKINCELSKVQQQIIHKKGKNNQLQIKLNYTKDNIVSLNLKNDNLVEKNNKLSEQINLLGQSIVQKNKINRKLNEDLIQLTSDYQKIKNQIEFKLNLSDVYTAEQIQLKANQQSLQSIIKNLQQQKAANIQQNLTLQSQIQVMKKLKSQNIRFKQNSQNHLAQLKVSNQILLQRMQSCCIQDRNIENLLMKKLRTLQMFSKKLNRQHQFEIESNIILKEKEKEKTHIFNEKSLNNYTRIPPYIKDYKDDIKQKSQKITDANTRSSNSPWCKENFA